MLVEWLKINSNCVFNLGKHRNVSQVNLIKKTMILNRVQGEMTQSFISELMEQGNFTICVLNALRRGPKNGLNEAGEKCKKCLGLKLCFVEITSFLWGFIMVPV